ncbi:MAG: M23 family metallopeptidase, partial [Gemmatimonadales bacterium]
MTRTRVVITAALVVTGLVWAVTARSTGRLPVAAPIVVSSAYIERSDRVRPNETLSTVFARHQIVGTDLLAALRVADGLNPRRVPVGMAFEFRYAVGEERADRVRTRLNDNAFLVLSRDRAGAWVSETEHVSWTVYTERVSGDINVSLDAAMRALVPDSVLPTPQRQQLVWAVAGGVFPWVIDFTRDMHRGDQVDVLYERLVSSIGEIKFGRVLAARLQSRGRPQFAYLFEDTDGANAYFDETGRSLRRAFKMYPVEYRRISSGFSRARLHPVLRTRRPHLGVDYAASRGAPVEATGDGTVVRANWWGGYGNVVVVRHAGGFETRYAHMNGFAAGVRAGTRVRQGQTIGYVGMTGLASGPHV